MPRVPLESPATGLAIESPEFIHTTDGNFVDNSGRVLLLRGVNLSGSAKAPVDRPSQLLDGFWEAAEDGGESFIGRPLNVDDGSADVHLARLRGWGFNMLRFPITWEALEHEGPEKYDIEFMVYTVRVLRKCKEYGFKVYMDPHQDIWSRFSGGSGAPFWTLAACGINPRNFTANQSAILHSEFPAAHDPDPATLPAMIWSTNYGRLASQTIFTLFFAGRDFAPRCIIDGKNIQDYLQGHYIAACGVLADKIRDAGDLLESCVLGWDSMNEPFEGLCGWPDLNATPVAQGSTLKKGTYPTPAQSLRLGMGQAQTVDNYTFGSFGPKRDGTVTIDPKGRKMWADEEDEENGVHPKWGWKRSSKWKLGVCLWAQHGVWDVESGYLIRPDYFKYAGDSTETVEFLVDYWRPHFELFGARIRQSQPEAILFVQPPVFAPPPNLDPEFLGGRAAYSAHYYDGLTLVTRHWNWFNADALGLLRGKYSSTLQAVKIGETAIRKSLQEQLGILKNDALTFGDGTMRSERSYPTVIGEIGTPFDMDSKRSYGWTDNGKYRGNYSNQERALDASMNAADGPNGISWTLWTYCTDSSHAWGDGWNMEDLSLWCPDDLAHGDDGEKKDLYRMDRGDVSTLKAKPAASMLSLATLPEDGVDVVPTGWREKQTPYEFLTDGARAFRAFSRPWPVKVIGLPQDIKFDIKKAEFTFTVQVRPEDAPVDPAAGRTPASISKNSMKKSATVSVEPTDQLATEIYIPLVHYAHERQLSRGQAASFDSGSLSGSTTKQSTASVQPYTDERTSAENMAIQASQSTGTDSTAGASRKTRGATPAYLTTESDLLDIDVKVSAGRWDVTGQTLRWWYPIPEAGKPAVEYTITVKRRSGVIKMGDIESAGVLDQLCPPEGCVIA